MAGVQKWALRGRPGAHPAGGPQVALFYWARWAGSGVKGQPRAILIMDDMGTPARRMQKAE